MVNMRAVFTWLLVFASLLASGCGPGGPKNVRVDPALLALVPPDTVMMAGARLDELRETPFFERLLRLGPPGRLDQFIAGAGVDPRSDVSEILVASNGNDGVLMLRGEFSATALEREGSEDAPYRGHLMKGDEEAAVLFVDSSTLLAGRPAVVRSIIDRRDEFTGVPAPLLEKMESIEPGNQIWAASLGGVARSPVPEAGNLGNAARLLERIQGATLAANLKKGLVFTARGEYASPEDAETLQGALRAVLGLARLGLRDKPALAAFCDAITVSRQELVVEVHADVTAELLGEVLAELVSEGVA